MKVSVAVITYNHERYIEQAIKSILKQKTKFEFEIVIGEDCSSDRTRSITREYQKKYPEKIRLLSNSGNKGMNKNFIDTLHNCQGEYIAYLEGDDYWTDEKKLQKQVDFLDKHKEYVLCYHLVKLFDPKNNYENIIPAERFRKDLYFKDIVISNHIPACSILFRRDMLPKWPDWLHTLKMMDWPLYLFLMHNGGRAGYINKNMAVYRVHSRGSHSSRSKIENNLDAIQVLKSFNRYFKFNFDKLFSYAITRYKYHLAGEYYRHKEFRKFIIILVVVMLDYRSWFTFLCKKIFFFGKYNYK